MILFFRVDARTLTIAATVKFFLFGSIDQSKEVAAHIVLRVGDRTLATRVVGAALEHGELRFSLAFGP